MRKTTRYEYAACGDLTKTIGPNYNTVRLDCDLFGCNQRQGIAPHVK